LIRYLAVIFVLTVGLPYAAQGDIQAPKNPNSAKGCAICHYRWIDTFFIEGKGTPLVPYQPEKVVASEEMCFSCHDGSVKDSRDSFIQNTGHKVNLVPPAHMKIPEIFPLDEQGRVQCATCHTAHGVPSGPDSRDTIFMRTSNRDSAMCRMCHPLSDGGMAAGNHPIGKSERAVPPRLIARGGAMGGSEETQMICQTCHTAHGSPYSGMLVLNGGDSGLCLVCHSDKAIFDDQGGRKPFHAIGVVPETAHIPDALFQKGAKLGDQGILTCQTCHKVHKNKEADHLLVMTAEKSDFCFTCHPDKRQILNGKHNLERTAPKEKNMQGHTTAQAGVCAACHLPHKPARRLSGQKDFTSQLCLSCHSKGNVAEKVNLAGNTHPLAVSPILSQAANAPFAAVKIEPHKLQLPLFNTYGVQDMRTGLMTCATCHNPHGSKPDTANATGERQGHFFLREQSPEICAQCHPDKFSIALSKHNLGKSAPDATNLLGRTPAQAGLCGSCHLVHGSHKGFLWARADEPESNGDGVGKGLCVNCHRAGAIGGDKISRGFSHPLNVAPSAVGITTRLPLFDAGARRSRTGVIRCATCHDPHSTASIQKSASPPAGGGQDGHHRFLRLDVAPQSALCVECHKNAGAVLKTDHDLTGTAPKAVNHENRTAAQSGPCSACHLVHNSRYKDKLWARDLGQGKHITQQMCTACHASGGPASGKVPLIASHPKSDIVTLGRNQKGRSNYFPVFSSASADPVVVGNISCPSCHDPHRWRSGSIKTGPDATREGDAGSSFLRTKSWNLPCKECHGREAIYKYSFFHNVAKRNRKKIP
jgi:predicted CXXCH cytochrome family protein